MTLFDLKKNLNNNIVPDDFIVFRCAEGFHFANDYVEAMSKHSGKPINYINTLAETRDSALTLVIDYDETLNVLKTDNFDEVSLNYGRYKGCVVICNTVDKKLEDLLKPYIIEIAPEKEWQTKAYMKAYCSGLNDNAINWLYSVTNGDYYKITNELDKLKLFEESKRMKVLAALRDDPNTDLYTMQIYSLVDTLLSTTHPEVLLGYLTHRKLVDLDGLGLCNMLLNKSKNILLLVHNKTTTPEALGMKSGQAYYIRKDFGGLSEQKLMKNIEFLSSLDNRLKSGKLELSNDRLIDYIICNIIY